MKRIVVGILMGLVVWGVEVRAGEVGPIAPGEQMRMPWRAEHGGNAFTAFIVRSAEANTVTVQIGQPGRRAVEGPGEVTCRVFGPGGRLVATQVGRSGETVSFDCGGWGEGPYEIRFFVAGVRHAMASPVVRWYKGDKLAAARALVREYGEGGMAGEGGKYPARGGPAAQQARRHEGTEARSEGQGGEEIVHLRQESSRAEGERVDRGTEGRSPEEMRANLRMLAELVLDRLGGNPEATAIPQNAENSVHSALMEYEELQMAARGEAAQIRGRGFFRLVYKDEVDDSWQFCRVYLPPDYDAARRWPLVVNLHGYYPSNPPYVRWWDVDRRQHPVAENHNVIVIEPHARGNAWYRGMGERDVMRCIELVQKRVSVNPDRILLMGYSMGGGGTWSIGTRQPHVFAAIAPVFGGWDYRATITAEDFAKLTSVDHWLAERNSSYVQAEGLLNTPVFVNHGDADELVAVEQTQYAVQMLQRWGYDVRYWEHPDLGHGGLNCEDEVLRWFLPRRRVVNPQHVRVRSAELKSARAHWLAVEQREDPLKLIVADARITDANTICLDTQNVLRVELSPGGAMIDPGRPITVVWNGADVRVCRMEDGRIVLDAKDFAAKEGCKTPRREGPIGDYQTTPFAIVLGTIADGPEMHAALQRRANDMMRDWESWQKTRPRFFSDNIISEEDVAKYSLVLVGGPRENLVAKRFAEKIPLQVSAEQITIDGRAFKVQNAAVQMVYPHPLNRERYVVVIAATSASAMPYAEGLPEDVDFAISDGRVSPRLGELTSLHGNDRVDPLALVASGFFDQNWRFNEKFVMAGDAALRGACAIRKVPRFAVAPQGGDVLLLSDLQETEAEGNFARMNRDLNYRGRALALGGAVYPTGLGAQIVREAPSYVEFNIAPGPWRRLRGVIGIEVKPNCTAMEKERTSVTFIVRGDGKELFRSGAFRVDSSPREIDVDVTGVRRLRLELTGEGRFNAATSCDWCNVRVERQ